MSRHILKAFRITADASVAYRKALTEEKQLLEELPAPWQQCIDDSSVLVQCTTQRLQQRFLKGEQSHAEAHIRSAHAYYIFMLVFCRAHLLWPLGDAIGLLFSSASSPAHTTGHAVSYSKSCVCRDVKRQVQEVRRRQSVKMHGEQAIAAAPMLQERHRDIMHKLIRANAELQILQLDGKQVRTCSVCCIASHNAASTCHYTQHAFKLLHQDIMFLHSESCSATSHGFNL